MALVTVSRLAVGTTFLYAWDSVLYARAIERFAVDLDPLVQRPHPPGSLFYVLAARAAALVTGDPNAALVAVSALCGGLAGLVALVVGRALFGTAAGVTAAAVLATSPLAWQYGAVAYPYTLLAALVGALGPLLWWSRGHGTRDVALVSAVFGLAAGFRQDVLLVLGPLWVFTAWRGPRAAAVSALAVAAGALTWIVPSAAASGGIARYADMVVRQWTGAAGSAVETNVAITGVGLAALLFAAWPFALIGAWQVARDPCLRPLFLLWTLPALALYLFVHVGVGGYVLSLAVPLAVLAGVGAAHLARAARWAPIVAAAVALACLANASWFLTADVISAAELRRRDDDLRARIAFVRTRSPTDTLIVAAADRLHALYYLAGYPAVHAAGPGATTIDAHGGTVVVFGDDLRVRVPAETIPLEGGSSITVLRPAGPLIVVDGTISGPR